MVLYDSAAVFYARGKGIFNFPGELRLFTPFHSIQNVVSFAVITTEVKLSFAEPRNLFNLPTE